MSLNPTDVNRQQSVHRWLHGQSPYSHMDDAATSHTDESLPSLESIPENTLPQPFHHYATLNNPLLTGAHDLEDVSFSDSESEQEQASIPPSDATNAADVASNNSITSENQSLFHWAISQPQDETDDESLPWVQLYPHNQPTSASSNTPPSGLYHNRKMRLMMKAYLRYSCTHIINQPLHHQILHHLIHLRMIFQIFTYPDCTWMMKEEK